MNDVFSGIEGIDSIWRIGYSKSISWQFTNEQGQKGRKVLYFKLTMNLASAQKHKRKSLKDIFLKFFFRKKKERASILPNGFVAFRRIKLQFRR